MGLETSPPNLPKFIYKNQLRYSRERDLKSSRRALPLEVSRIILDRPQNSNYQTVPEMWPRMCVTRVTRLARVLELTRVDLSWVRDGWRWLGLAAGQ